MGAYNSIGVAPTDQEFTLAYQRICNPETSFFSRRVNVNEISNWDGPSLRRLFVKIMELKTQNAESVERYQDYISIDLEEREPIEAIEHYIERCKKELKRCAESLNLNKLKGTIPNWDNEIFNRMITILAHQSIPDAALKKISHNLPRIGTLDNLLLAFSHFSADHEPNNPWQAMQTLQLYGAMLFLPLLLSTLIADVIDQEYLYLPPGLDPLGIFFGLVAFMGTGLAALKIYQHFHPLPNHIKPLRNATLDAKKGLIEPLLFRDDIVKRIFACWEVTSTSIRQYPLLVGPPGTGKTVILSEVARRIASGQVPESLKKTMKGVQVFQGSASLFIATNKEEDDKLGRFKRIIEPHKDKVVMSLDEIHALYNEENGPLYGETLKSMFGTGPDCLPFIIGATTHEEYIKYIAKDASRARRFCVIDINPLTKAEVINILKIEMYRYPTLTVSAGFLNHLYDETEGLRRKFSHLVQPSISTEIFTLTMETYLNRQKKLPEEETVRKLKAELAALQSKFLDFIENEEENEKGKNLHDLVAAIEKKEKLIQAYEHAQNNNLQLIKDLNTLSEQILEMRKKLIVLSSKIEALSGPNLNPNQRQSAEKKKKKFIFIHHYLLPEFKKNELILKKQLGVPSLKQIVENEIIKKEKTLLNVSAKPKGGNKDADATTTGGVNQAKAIATDPTKGINLHRFYNIGDSCYLNASLQLIFNCEEIRELIIQQEKVEPKNPFVQQLYQLMNSPKPSKTDLVSFRDQCFHYPESLLASADINKQQDVSEALMQILKVLEWTPLKIQDYSQKKGGIEEKLGDLMNINILPSVPITQSSFQTIIDDYFKKEKRTLIDESSGNPFKAEYWKQIEDPSPTSFMIQLNKYHCEGGKNNLIFKKNDTYIKFPDDGIVRIGVHDYEITGLINHKGESPKEGHYSALIKNIRNDAEKDTWFCCDDSTVTEKKFPIASKKVYMVLLRKIQKDPSSKISDSTK